MGYIRLNTPICHVWYLYNHLIPTLLDYSYEDTYDLIYYSFLKKFNPRKAVNNIYSFSHFIFPSNYIQYKLSTINIIELISFIKNNLFSSKDFSKSKFYYMYKNITLLHSLIINNINPEWFMMEILPVIPAGLRPCMEVNEDTFVISSITELYRMILIVNNRIKRFKEIRNYSTVYLEVIEKINLQKLVDKLLTFHKNENNESLSRLDKSFFKNYILGKRVNFSGRSVIVSGPSLTYLHIGFPLEIGLNLFEHNILNFLKENLYFKDLFYLDYYFNNSKLILKRILKYIYSKEFVMVNRAPTLHRMNVQTFKPSFIEGHSIRLFPLACSGFNADFDGDQMGVFILNSPSAKKEVRNNIVTDKNIFHPSTFKNIFKYTQSILLGLNTLLSIVNRTNSHQLIFNSIEEALNSYTHGLIGLNTIFILKFNLSNFISSNVNKKYILTSIGRLLIKKLI